MTGETVYIGIGSNRGDRFDLCERAVNLLCLLPRTTVTGLSSLYETDPVADVGDPGPDPFLNGVIELTTDLEPHALLDACREIETALGRDQQHRRGPRTMDLDLLVFGERVLDDPSLTIPHPRLHERRFVLAPLAELAPHWRHPLSGRTAAELLARLGDRPAVRRLDVIPGSRYGPRPACSTPPPGD